MITFNEHFSIVSKIKSLFSFLKEKIKDLLDLSFGQKKTMVIDLSKLRSEILTEDVDLKSHMGYYAEFVTAYKLSLILEQNGGNLTTERSQPSVLKKKMDEKKKDLMKLKPLLSKKDQKSFPDELSRMEISGDTLSKTIFGDIRLNGYDYNALQFDIELTGDSEKGVSKSDLILTAGKMDKKEIVDRINASLKAYKSSRINLSNSTFISLFKTIFYDNPKAWGNNTEKFILSFVKDYGSNDDIRQLYKLQNIIKTKMEKGSSKEASRKYAKTTHGDVIEIMVKIFNKHYKQNKEKVNSRVLKMLGFDSAEDFYAAIGDSKKQKVVSSRRSDEMNEMLDNLKKGFVLIFERNGKTNNANMFFNSIDGTEIIKANLTFTDTGGQSGFQGKTNAFVDIKPYITK